MKMFELFLEKLDKSKEKSQNKIIKVKGIRIITENDLDNNKSSSTKIICKEI